MPDFPQQRHAANIERFEAIEHRLEHMETNIARVLTILEGSRMVAETVKWTAAVGASAAAIWAALHFGKVV